MSDSVTVERVDGDPSSIHSFLSSFVNNVSHTSIDDVEIVGEGYAYKDITIVWTS